MWVKSRRTYAGNISLKTRTAALAGLAEQIPDMDDSCKGPWWLSVRCVEEASVKGAFRAPNDSLNNPPATERNHEQMGECLLAQDLLGLLNRLGAGDDVDEDRARHSVRKLASSLPDEIPYLPNPFNRHRACQSRRRAFVRHDAVLVQQLNWLGCANRNPGDPRSA
jgi:hypothetical protein